MTPEEHNKYLGYSHLGYAAMHLLMMLAMSVFFFIFIMLMAANDPNGGPPAVLFAVILCFVLIFQILFTLPSAIAGFGLLKQKQWAKTWSLIAGVMSAMSFPVGTAVCIYTFWFLLGEAGKDFYTRPTEEGRTRTAFLHEAASSTDASGNWQKRSREYVPPKEMPNWRD